MAPVFFLIEQFLEVMLSCDQDPIRVRDNICFIVLMRIVYLLADVSRHKQNVNDLITTYQTCSRP